MENHPSELIENQIKRRKWNWSGHTIRKETRVIEKTVSDRTLHGYSRRGMLSRTWRRTIEDEIRSTRRSWNDVSGIAGDRTGRKLSTDPLCSTRSERIWRLQNIYRNSIMNSRLLATRGIVPTTILVVRWLITPWGWKVGVETCSNWCTSQIASHRAHLCNYILTQRVLILCRVSSHSSRDS